MKSCNKVRAVVLKDGQPKNLGKCHSSLIPKVFATTTNICLISTAVLERKTDLNLASIEVRFAGKVYVDPMFTYAGAQKDIPVYIPAYARPGIIGGV